MYSHIVFEPFEKVPIDCLSPIRPSITGKKFIIVAIDMFSRFVEAKAIPDQQASTSKKFLVRYFCYFGVAKGILTDKKCVKSPQTETNYFYH